ncbi:MAG: AAA family ATPase, partial [Planctomycetota bacterium]
DAGFQIADLLTYYRGGNVPVCYMALEALAQRNNVEEDVFEPLMAGVANASPFGRYFVLRALAARVRRPILADLLSRIDDSWDDPYSPQFLSDFVGARLRAGENVVFHDGLKYPEDDEFLRTFLRDLDGEGVDRLREAFEVWLRSQVDVDFLRSFGRVWDEEAVAAEIFTDQLLEQRVETMERILHEEPRHSAVLVGEDGVGKTTALCMLGRRLLAKNWVVFEAGAVELMAGQSFIGELEERLQRMVRSVGGRPRVLWIVPDLYELIWAGRHRHSQTSILDMLMPHIAAGTLVLIGEITPAQHERLLLEKPQLRVVMETLRCNALDQDKTLALARQWCNAHRVKGDTPLVDETTLREAAQLSQQYRGDQATPGSLLDLLELARQSRAPADPDAADASPAEPIDLDEIFRTLSRLTGLPVSMLDDRQGLDLDSLRTHFGKRVLGQPEAVDCLVDRVAMIKAGLVDPGRPPGVFLFTGPTGTGKTEIAKTLADFLFGSPSRMIRLDMSEFQTIESLDRILGDSEELSRHEALVNLIRKQPFSVVLLDEVEKAHPNVWDLFLQVFDDGRLTDRRGRLADFRHAIIIMTSNVGGNVLQGAELGFGGGTAGPDKIMAGFFRPEFINRIDRMVVFRSLSKSTMRKVLLKELADVLQRRGLRNRQWAVEWDESAIDFLLQKGFTPDLGARPLRRAIERYVLSPLAVTIVNHQVPEGDQFLLVRSDGDAIDVEFIDPDAAEEPQEPTVRIGRHGVSRGDLDLKTIALESAGTRAEVDYLATLLADLQQHIAADSWRGKKRQALDALSQTEFWESQERFAVLSRAEYMDRIETGIKTAGRLLQRLRGRNGSERTQFRRDLVARLARQLYLLENARAGLGAGEAGDALLRIEVVRDSKTDLARANRFADELLAMYQAWAQQRGMQMDVLEQTTTEGGRHVVLGTVSGYGVFTILRQEDGIHVLEVEGDGKIAHRLRVSVAVAKEPDGPPQGRRDVLIQARALFSDRGAVRPRIVRRYRRKPSPLIRDSVRGWRTGRWDTVLQGNFDLVS